VADSNNSLDNEGNTYQYVNYSREYHYYYAQNQNDNAGNKRYHGKTQSKDIYQPDYDEVAAYQVVENPGENHYHDAEDKRQDANQKATTQNAEYSE